MQSAYDTMISDDTFSLLEEYYGDSIDLSTALASMDKEAIIRLLNDIIEEEVMFPELAELSNRAKVAKRELSS